MLVNIAGYIIVGFAHAKCFLYNDTAGWFGPDLSCQREETFLNENLLGWGSSSSLCILLISAIRCGEPEDIPNGILERKCQTFGCRSVV